jgi:hypothetical protein
LISRGVMLGAVALALLVLWFGWPTPYRYDHWRYDGDEYPVRISRVTGNAEFLSRVGWRPLRAPRQPVMAPAPAAMDTGMRASP